MGVRSRVIETFSGAAIALESVLLLATPLMEQWVGRSILADNMLNRTVTSFPCKRTARKLTRFLNFPRSIRPNDDACSGAKLHPDHRNRWIGSPSM